MKQRGFALLELTIAAAITLLLAVWASQTLAHRMQEANAQSAALWMLNVREAVMQYVQTHYRSLQQADTPSALAAEGILQWQQPTFKELQQQGFISASLPPQTHLVQSLAIYIARSGVCPGDACQLEAIVYSQQPLLNRSGQVDEAAMAQWLLASQGYGGTVHPARPHRLQGQLFDFSNPVLSADGALTVAPGTVALAITLQQFAAMDFLRVQDERNPDFQGDLSVAGAVQLAGNTTVGGYLRINHTASLFGPCDTNGAIARDQQAGLLVCVWGSWQFGSRHAGAYSINSIYGCYSYDGRSTRNPITNSCSCPPGTQEVLVSDGTQSINTHGVTRGFVCV